MSLKKGVIPTPRGARNVRRLVTFPREEHSKKPVKVIEGISKMFPFQEKFILFARENYNGLDNWGLEISDNKIDIPTSIDLENRKTNK